MDKDRTLTVKGTGNLEIRPDQVEILLTIEAKDKDYEKSVEKTEESVEDLTDALIEIGFDKTSLKTSNWQCEQVFNNVQTTKKVKGKEVTEWQDVFDCYKTTHKLKLVFGIEEKALPVVIGAIAGCESVPEFEVKFTIKDKTAAAGSLLAEATKNAKMKAQIIADAAEIKLGAPVTVQYDWNEYHFYSDTHYSPVTTRNMRAGGQAYCQTQNFLRSYNHSIEPENIRLRDTVTITWEIE